MVWSRQNCHLIVKSFEYNLHLSIPGYSKGFSPNKCASIIIPFLAYFLPSFLPPFLLPSLPPSLPSFLPSPSFVRSFINLFISPVS